MVTDTPTLSEIVDSCVKELGTQRQVAEVLHISRPRIGRAIEGIEHLSVESCLRLAGICEYSPGEILRASGKGEVADLIEQHYGRQTISVPDRQLLAKWHLLPPKQRRVVTDLIDVLARLAPNRGGNV